VTPEGFVLIEEMLKEEQAKVTAREDSIKVWDEAGYRDLARRDRWIHQKHSARAAALALALMELRLVRP
jgi:hypothetical protein